MVYIILILLKWCGNGKIHKNKRKRLYSSSKEGLICWYKSITANFCKFVLTKFQVKITSQVLKYTNKRFLYQIVCWIVLYSNYFHKTWVICSFLKAKQSACLSFKGSRSNRPQVKSTPVKSAPRSNHCIIMGFFYLMCFTLFFHTGKSHVRHFCCLLLSTCKVKYS